MLNSRYWLSIIRSQNAKFKLTYPRKIIRKSVLTFELWSVRHLSVKQFLPISTLFFKFTIFIQ